MKLKLVVEEKGGTGSGHHGHGGRPGKVGGSSPGVGAGGGPTGKAGWDSMRRSGIDSFIKAGGERETAEALQRISTDYLESLSDALAASENLRRRPADWEFYKLIGIELGYRENVKS